MSIKKSCLIRFVSAMLMTLILFNSLQIPAINAGTNSSPMEIEFDYSWPGDSTVGLQEYQAICYYTDDYFDLSSHEYNPSLTMASLCLTMSLIDTVDTTKPHFYSNLEDLFIKMGFPKEKFLINDGLLYEPTTTSMGVAASSKSLNDGSTLIAFIVRAGDYRSEWANNFVVGKSGHADGFDNSKDVTIDFINEYIDKMGITGDVKIWITGYSRGATGANLTGGAINEKPSVIKNVNFTHEDVYTICFLPTMTAERKGNSTNMEEGHENVHNIVNKDDFIGKLFPPEHGFGLYGVNHWIPNIVFDADFQEKFSKFLEFYNIFEKSPETLDMNSSYTLIPNIYSADGSLTIEHENPYPIGQFVDEFLEIYNNFVIKSRSEYVDKMQNTLTILFTYLMGDVSGGVNKDSISKFAKIFINRLTDLDIFAKLLFSQIPYLNDLSGHSYEVINTVLTESLNAAGINNLSPIEIKNIVDSTLEIIIKLMINCPDHITTVVNYIGHILFKHFPRYTYSWLALTDINYFNDNYINRQYLPDAPIKLIENPDYRTIRIFGDVDIEVYDDGNNLVGKMQNNKAIISDIAITMNYEGEKLIFLPMTNEYDINLTAASEGTLSYVITEFSYGQYGVTRLIDYNGISVKNGDTISGNVPANSSNYTLKLGGNTLKPNRDLKGKNAANQYYSVYVDTGNTLQGYIIGRGIRMAGHYATVTAVAAADYMFDGWYINNIKVSDLPIFRFRVESDVNIVAKFVSVLEDTPVEQPKKTIILPLIDMNSMVHNINFHVNGGSSVKQQQVKHGGQLTEPDSPTKKKMIFDGWYIDEALTKEYDFSNSVTSSFKLYAKWTEAEL